MVTRRKFLASSGAAAAVVTLVPRHVLGGPGKIAPSEKITLAYIGCGTQGLREMIPLLAMPQVQITAVCDPVQDSQDYVDWSSDGLRASIANAMSKPEWRRNKPGIPGGREVAKELIETVYAQQQGSVAAPTAGLHFTPEILARIRQHGIDIAEITLHVGLGTFQPVRVENIEQHKIHRERFTISPETAGKINRALAENRRIVAVGTTTVRTLEYAASQDSAGRISPGSAEADIFIYPGFRFRVIGALLTNFHLPQSTLLMLVSAFAGRKTILKAYRYAVNSRYRFFSYGDCMFIE